MTTKHTKTPWHQNGMYVNANSARPVCEIAEAHGEDDAAFIVRACNSHERLVDVLEKMTKVLEDYMSKYPVDSKANSVWLSAKSRLAKAKEQ